MPQLRLTRLFEAGFVDRLRPYATRGSGSYPWTYHLAERGRELVAATTRTAEVHDFGRVVHDLQVNGWVLAYRRALGAALGAWLGEQDGTTAPPRDLPRRPRVGDWTVAGLRLTKPRPVRPDALLDVGDARVFIELDRTRRPDKNYDKFDRYDSFLTWWWRETEHAAAPKGPIVVFVCPDEDVTAAFMATADERMTGRLQHPAAAAADQVHPGRKRTFFVDERAIYSGDARAAQLPAFPQHHPAAGARNAPIAALLPGAVAL